MESVCGDFIKRVAKNINDADAVDTGKIQDLTMSVISSTKIQIEGQSYINYIDEGVQGSENINRAPLSPYKYTNKMPPPSVFKDWILSKNIKVRNTSYNMGEGDDKVINVNDDNIDSVAYAMARDRFKNGVEPKPIFKKEIPQLLTDAQKVVGQITINNIFSNLNLK